MKINGKVAVITGASGGIGRAVCEELVGRGIRHVAMVDLDEGVIDATSQINRKAGREVAKAYQGDTTDSEFRRGVYDQVCAAYGGPSRSIRRPGRLTFTRRIPSDWSPRSTISHQFTGPSK
jgi:NAD(P)-dependent dehydrogenase (short-subunit alcohol dehydrogenase family)